MNDFLASVDRRGEEEIEAAMWQARALRSLERSPDQIGETLGRLPYEEVIHRDNLTVTV